jgi:DNA polymerase
VSSQSARNALFLDEMGLGPQWTLRAAAVPDMAAAPAAMPAAMAAAIPAVSSAVMPAVMAAPMPVAIQAAAPAPAPATPVSAQAISAMDWTELAFAAASCTRCDLCHGRSKAVFGRGARDAALIVLGSAPSSADEEAGAPLCGAPGQLLDNMLLAIGLAPADVYVTSLVKCRAAAAPTPEQLSACRPYLERELALLAQGRTLLALGQPAARSLLGPALPSAALRGTAHRWGAFAVVATLHPEDMLKGQAQGQGVTTGMAEDKAKAWADLCVARGAHAAGP